MVRADVLKLGEARHRLIPGSVEPNDVGVVGHVVDQLGSCLLQRLERTFDPFGDGKRRA
jgi:hypothetical protein